MTEKKKCGIIMTMFRNQLTAEDVGSFLFFVDILDRHYRRKIGINDTMGWDIHGYTDFSFYYRIDPIN